ncbi:hypothetical protein QEG73_19605 [Chitinophagaceae bacterium 26-R-25]|nr:hypothetical protein [Chitinophagaceae bacterium 26-R-25]
MEQPPHFRFTSYLSPQSLDLLKEQVLRVMRDQLDEPLVEPFLAYKPTSDEVFLYADYSLSEFSLPIDFGTLLWKNEVVEVNVHIPFAIINGWAPVQMVSKGHKYVCLLQFVGDIPEVLRNLPEVNSGESADSVLILTRKVDLPIKGI